MHHMKEVSVSLLPSFPLSILNKGAIETTFMLSLDPLLQLHSEYHYFSETIFIPKTKTMNMIDCSLVGMV